MQKNLILVVLAAALAIGIYETAQAWRWRNEVRLLKTQQTALLAKVEELQHERDEATKRLDALSAKLSLRLPAPPTQFSAPLTESAEHSPSTNLFGGFERLKRKAPNKLAAEQVQPYLKAHGRSAASLLAAYRATGDKTLLAEAAQQGPNDPQVALAAVLQKDASPESRRQWLETFKQSDARNALPYYLSALNYLQAGQLDQAVPELMAASGKTQFQDYSAQRAQADAQVYLAAGYSVAEANALAPLQQAMDFATADEEQVAATFATFESQSSALQSVKALALNLRDLAKSYQASGDTASAEAALRMAGDLGRHYSDTCAEDGMSQLVGMAAEVLALSGMNPASSYDGDGQTVQERINQLRQRRTAVKGLYLGAAPLLGTMSEQDWATYADRARFFGEPAALQWVIGKYGTK